MKKNPGLKNMNHKMKPKLEPKEKDTPKMEGEISRGTLATLSSIPRYNAFHIHGVLW